MASIMETSPAERKETSFEKWMEKVSAVGWSRIHTKSKRGKRLWIVIMFAAYCCLAAHAFLLLRQYFNYEVTNTLLIGVAKAEMPDITICRQGVYESENESLPTDARYGAYLWKYAYQDNREIDKLRNKQEYIQRASVFEQLKDYNQLDGYLITCSYMGERCDMRNFSKVEHPIVQNCYTFKPNDRIINRKGLVMSMILDSGLPIGSRETPLQWFHGNGTFLVTVQEEGTLPDPLEKGIEVVSGRKTNIHFNARKIEMESTPVGKCNERKYVDYGVNGKFTGRKGDCFRLLAQKTMIEKCGCKSPFFVLWDYPVENCFKLPSNISRFPLAAQHKMLRRDGEPYKCNAKIYEGHEKMAYDFYIEEEIEQTKKALACHQRVVREMEQKYLNIECVPRCQSEEVSVTLVDRDVEEFSNSEIKQLAEGPIATYFNNPKVWCETRENKCRIWRDANGEQFVLSLVDVHFCEDYLKEKKNATRVTKAFNKSKYIEELILLHWNDLYHKFPMNHSETYAKSKKRLVQINIQAEGVPATILREQLAYPVVSLFSEMGGILGLWAGISVISICEFVELTTIGLRAANKGCKNRKAVSKEVSPVKLMLPAKPNGTTKGNSEQLDFAKARQDLESTWI